MPSRPGRPGRPGSRTRRGRPARGNAPVVAGVVLFVFAGAVIAALFLLRPDAVPRDAETMCPDAGPSRVTAILVDTTDRVGAVSRADLLGQLDDLAAASEPDEMIVAYESQPISEAVGSDPLPALLTVCNPGDPDTANELIQSPALLRKRLEERYREPLERLFQDLLDRRPAPGSPLMENVQAIAVTLLARRSYDAAPKRLILVSDLLQHSENLTFYDGRPEFAAFRDSPGAAALGADLGGIEFEVLLIQREIHESFGGARSVVSFWERWIAEQGGSLARVRRIPGMN